MINVHVNVLSVSYTLVVNTFWGYRVALEGETKQGNLWSENYRMTGRCTVGLLLCCGRKQQGGCQLDAWPINKLICQHH